MVSLADFLICGDLGNITKDTHIEDVISLFGDAYNIGSPSKKITILQYDNIEISFMKNQLLLIAIYNKQKKFKELSDSYILDFDQNNLVSFLNKNNTLWKVINLPHFPNCIKFKINDLLEVIFDSEWGGLYAITRQF